MARSAIISLGVVFVLAVLIKNEVQASQCMNKCNRQCLKTKQANGVSCGVQCFVQCMNTDNPNSKLSPDMQKKMADLKKKSLDGSMSQDDVEDELRDIALTMVLVSETTLHLHDHKSGEQPKQAPKVPLKADDSDITDEDD